MKLQFNESNRQELLKLWDDDPTSRPEDDEEAVAILKLIELGFTVTLNRPDK